MTGYILYPVWVESLLTSSAKLLEINLQGKMIPGTFTATQKEKEKKKKTKTCCYLVCALDTPHIGTLPAKVTVSAVVVAVLLLQKLSERDVMVGEDGQQHVQRLITIRRQYWEINSNQRLNPQVSSEIWSSWTTRLQARLKGLWNKI